MCESCTELHESVATAPANPEIHVEICEDAELVHSSDRADGEDVNVGATVSTTESVTVALVALLPHESRTVNATGDVPVLVRGQPPVSAE